MIENMYNRVKLEDIEKILINFVNLFLGVIYRLRVLFVLDLVWINLACKY